MFINFTTIRKDDTAFKIENDTIIFGGNYKKKNRSFIEINATIKGKLPCICDICAEIYDKDVDENVHFLVHDGPYNGNNEINELDIIESLQGKVDMDDILLSEIESIKTDYNACNQCNTEGE